MRQQVDLAVLRVQINEGWFEPQFMQAQPMLTRIVCHDLMWERDREFVPPSSESHPVSLRTDLLFHAAVRLRRYDALVVPVSMETLAWTRRLLASIPRGPNIPVIGVLRDVHPAGMVDLLELGMIDFVQCPINLGELRARILCAVSRAPRRMVLRDRIMGSGAYHPEYSLLRRAALMHRAELERKLGPLGDGEGPIMADRMHIWGNKYTSNGQGWAGDPKDVTEQQEDDLPIVVRLRRVFENRHQTFGEVKAKLIAEFESQYVKDALAMQNGNVARAAAASGKNRRAFWEIMRKHKISAKAFRDVG